MRRAVAFAVGFALMAAWWPGIAGVATTPRWDVGALLAIPVFVGGLGSQVPRTTAVHLFGVALIAWLALSLTWSSAPLDGIDTLAKLLITAGAFLFGTEIDDPRPFVAGAAVGLIPSSLIAIAQWFGWHPVESYGQVGGLFYNGDRLAGAAALVFAAAIGLRMWWALPGLAPALVLPLSRGAWLAAGSVIIVTVWQRGRTFERFVCVVILGYLGAMALMLAPVWHWTSIDERLTILSWTVSHLDLAGHGLGSFAQNPLLLPSSASTTHPEHPHSEWLWLAYEGGALAVALCGCLFAGLLRAGDFGSHLVVGALAVLSLFAMPFHDPGTVLFAAVVAGAAARPHRDLCASSDIGGDRVRQGLSAAGVG